MTKLTRPQREALFALWQRDAGVPASARFYPPIAPNYRAFRRQVQPGWNCVMIHLWNMWIGIEEDGYTHS